MKYVVSWDIRPAVTEEDLARPLEVFGKWLPSEGSDFKEFLGRVDGRGGFAVVAVDDVALLAKDIAPFGAWFDFTVHPVLEIADATAIQIGAVEFLSSVS